MRGLRWPAWMWKAPAGPSTLRIIVQLNGGGVRDLSRTVEIHPAHYRTGSLTVAPKFVEPGPEELKRIEADSAAEGEGVCGQRARAALVGQTFARR